jgi:hypothetical protein
VLAAFLGAALVTSCSNESTDEVNNETDQVHSTQYFCPMKCEGEKTYKAPGSCPKCGMDLVVKK